MLAQEYADTLVIHILLLFDPVPCLWLVNATLVLGGILNESFRSSLRYVCYPPTGRTDWCRFHLPTGDAGSFNSRAWMHRCVARTIAMLILDFMTFVFRNRTFLISWRGFLQGSVVLLRLHFQALHHMKLLEAKSDCVGPGKLWMKFPFVHAEGPHPVSDECWRVEHDSQYARPQCNQFDVSRYSLFCWYRPPFGLFNICATTW